MPHFPDADMVHARREYLEQKVWPATHRNWRKTDEFYHRTFKVWDNATDRRNRGQYRPSTGTNIIDHATDQFAGYIPFVHREPVNPTSDTHKESANRAEIGMKFVMRDAVAREMFNSFKQIRKHFNAYGYGILSLDLDFTDMRRLRPTPGYWNPIRLTAPHPTRVLMDPTQKKPDAATEIMTMTAGRLSKLLKRKSSLKTLNRDLAEQMLKRDPFEEIKLERDWTTETETLSEMDGRVYYSSVNGWGFVPHMQAFAGYGMEPSDLSKNDPQFMAVGILTPIMDSIVAEAQIETAKRHMVIANAYSPLGARDPDEFFEALETGKIVRGERQDFFQVQMTQATRDVFDAGRGIQEDIRRGTFNPGLSGFRDAGVVTVGQQQMLDHSASKKFSSPAMHEEDMASNAATWIARLVRTLPQLRDGIGAHGKLLKRGDLFGVDDFGVTFEAIDPVLQQQRQEGMRRDYELGLLDEETYWEQGERVADTTTRRRRLLQSRIRRFPGMDALIIEGEARAMDDVTEEGVEAVTEAARQGLLPFEPQPGTPQVARPLRQPLGADTAKPARIDNLGEVFSGE